MTKKTMLAQEYLNQHYPPEEGQDLIDLSQANEELEGTLFLSGYFNLIESNCSGKKITSLEIESCPNLEILDCSDNDIEKLNLGVFPPMQSLKKLIAFNNRISFDSNATLFYNLHSLQEINLRDNFITADIRLVFPYLKSLKKLDISNNDFTGELNNNCLKDSVNLEILSIENNRRLGDCEKFTISLKDLFEKKRGGASFISFASKRTDLFGSGEKRRFPTKNLKTFNCRGTIYEKFLKDEGCSFDGKGIELFIEKSSKEAKLYWDNSEKELAKNKKKNLELLKWLAEFQKSLNNEQPIKRAEKQSKSEKTETFNTEQSSSSNKIESTIDEIDELIARQEEEVEGKKWFSSNWFSTKPNKGKGKAQEYYQTSTENINQTSQKLNSWGINITPSWLTIILILVGLVILAPVLYLLGILWKVLYWTFWVIILPFRLIWWTVSLCWKWLFPKEKTKGKKKKNSWFNWSWNTSKSKEPKVNNKITKEQRIIWLEKAREVKKQKSAAKSTTKKGKK